LVAIFLLLREFFYVMLQCNEECRKTVLCGTDFLPPPFTAPFPPSLPPLFVPPLLSPLSSPYFISASSPLLSHFFSSLLPYPPFPLSHPLTPHSCLPPFTGEELYPVLELLLSSSLSLIRSLPLEGSLIRSLADTLISLSKCSKPRDQV
jgi:hypothetical protein